MMMSLLVGTVYGNLTVYAVLNNLLDPIWRKIHDTAPDASKSIKWDVLAADVQQASTE